jgi:uncharacterized protein
MSTYKGAQSPARRKHPRSAFSVLLISVLRRSVMKHFLLFYDVADDYVARRATFRDAHLEKAWDAQQRGELVLGGALANPVDGAVLLFHAASPDVVEAFARSDPYVLNGLVKQWRVREWNTVAGKDAVTPVQPHSRQ